MLSCPRRSYLKTHVQSSERSVPSTAAALPLAPYRVLDLTTEHAYLAGRILGDLGADVVKVEPPSGDPGRRFGPFYHDDAEPGKSLSWWAFNANKRSITLNITTADGQALLKQLAATADFVVESYPAGHLDGLGLGYRDMAAQNPSLVMASVTPFGPAGPRYEWAATDLTILAAGGLMHLAGNEDRAPLQVSVPQARAQAGAQAALAALTAHHHRRMTGRGQHIQVSMQGSIVNTLIDFQQHWDINKKLGERGLRTSWGPLKQRVLYKCKDGYIAWKWFVDKGRGRRNTGLLQWMREEEADEGVADWDFEAMTLYSMKQEQADRVEAAASKFFLTKTKAEVYRQALKRRFLCFPVYGPSDIMADEQMQYRGFFRDVPHPELKASVRYPGPFARTTACDYGLRRRPPLIGEHNEQVYLGDLGLTRDELTTLREAGVI
jgi:crotonobetainyl-CoA:carnitine CoA-transferase CaiB-like acyl-CoA transferase